VSVELESETVKL